MSELIKKHLEALKDADKQTIAEVERHIAILEEHNIESAQQMGVTIIETENGYNIEKKKPFSEGKHKRDKGGQFSTQEGAKEPKEKKPPKQRKQQKERKPGNIGQEEAKYTDSSKVSGQRCSNCINILRMKNSPVRRCTKVRGVILDTGWSQFWQASKKEQDPIRV